MNLQQQVSNLLIQQIKNWELANQNYKALETILSRELTVGGIKISIQFNPARIQSTNATVSATAVNKRPCFLCSENRPKEQKYIPYNNKYLILVNPYPIFPKHFTIPYIIHSPQQPFDWKKDFESRYQPHIHALWLIFSPEYIRRFYKNIRKYAHIIETRLTDHTDAPEIMIEENSYNLHMCRVHGCSYLRMDEKYDLSAVEHFPQTPENVSGIKENLDSGSENR